MIALVLILLLTLLALRVGWGARIYLGRKLISVPSGKWYILDNRNLKETAQPGGSKARQAMQVVSWRESRTV